MAHKNAGGSSKNGRDSESKRLGVKIFGGQQVKIEDLRFFRLFRVGIIFLVLPSYSMAKTTPKHQKLPKISLTPP